MIEDRGEYQYNGLHQRTIHRLDTDDPPDGTLDQQRYMYYDAAWRLFEEEIWDGWSSGAPGSIDRHIQYVWGVRYIDDLAYRRIDTNGDSDYDDAGDKTYYALTDAQFSCRAMIDDSGALVEWVDYTPYGEARHHHKYDVDADDGGFDSSDRAIVSALADVTGFPPDPTDIDEFGYRAEADINRDGTIDGDDLNAMGTSYTSAVSAGLISTPGGIRDNIIGYDGYVFNQESVQYSVRFRTYDPGLGRWIERDPAGHGDSLNLYEYVKTSPSNLIDPLGLGITWTFKQCRDIPTGRRKWERTGQSVAVRQQVGPMPTPEGWFGVVLEVWSIFFPRESVTFQDAGDYWDKWEQHPGSLNRVTCRCEFQMYEEICETCICQKKELVHTPQKQGWPFAWKEIGKAYITKDCDWYPKGPKVYTYGMLFRSPWGRGYTCSCKTPNEIADSLKWLLSQGKIPKDQEEEAKRIIRDWDT